MGTKTLIRLLIALAVIGGIAAILHFTGSGGRVLKPTSTTTKKKVFSDFPINEVATISIRETEGTVTLRKGEKSWEVVEREGYPANAEPIVSLLKDVWDLNIAQLLTIGRSQYGRLHMLSPEDPKSGEEAATILSFQDSAGKELASLWLGKVFARSENRPDPYGGGIATTDAGRYVKRGDSNSVYLVSETFDSVKPEPSEWIDKTFFKVPSVKTIELKTKEKANDWKLIRDDAAEDFTLENASPGEELDAAKTSSMKSAFANPQMEDVFTGESAKENKTDNATITITSFDGFTYVVSVGEKNDLNELALSLKVSGSFNEKRTPGEEESDEEKKRLDEEFEKELNELKEKLAAEKALEGHVFKVRSYLVDSILKKRSELFAEKKQDENTSKGEEIAPGVSLPGIPGIPKAAPKAAPKSKGKAEASPKQGPKGN